MSTTAYVWWQWLILIPSAALVLCFLGIVAMIVVAGVTGQVVLITATVLVLVGAAAAFTLRGMGRVLDAIPGMGGSWFRGAAEIIEERIDT